MRSLILFLILAVATACQSPQQAEEAQQAWDSVMRVHDEAMTQMGTLNRTKTQLGAYLDGSAELAEEQRQEIEQTMENLSAAQDGMMNWMSNLVSPLDSLRASRSHEEVMEYLAAEQAAVNKVQEDINAALDAGRHLLGSLEER